MQTINTDKHILEVFDSNKVEGFRLLVITYRERLYFHIRKILILHEDSDDALQNTFIKVWDNIKNFKGESMLSTWLYKIATNEALAILKKRKKELKYDPADLESIFNQSAEADSLFDGDEIYKKLLNAVRQLPEVQQLVFNMRYFDQLKYKEISAILSTSVGALKASYHHARKKIEETMKLD